MAKLKPTKTRVSTSPVVGVRDAHLRLSLRAISRSEFTLKRVETRVTRTVEIVLADPPKSVFATLLPKKPVQLNHAQPRVTKTPIVGVRDAFHRLALRAIERGEFSLKSTPETRISRTAVVVREQKRSCGNAALLRRHAAILSQLAAADDDAFEAVRIFRDLDAKARSVVMELLKL
jgi:hypothetical protein